MILRFLFTLVYAVVSLPICIIGSLILWLRSIPLVWDKRKSLRHQRKETVGQDVIGDAVRETMTEIQDAMQPHQPMSEDDPVVFYPYKSNGRWD